MQSGVARMLISTDELEWQSEIDYANRAFAAMIGGQRYENIPAVLRIKLNNTYRSDPLVD